MREGGWCEGFRTGGCFDRGGLVEVLFFKVCGGFLVSSVVVAELLRTGWKAHVPY